MIGYQENQVEKKDIKSIPKSTLTLLKRKMSKNDIVRDVKGFNTSLLRIRQMSLTTTVGEYFPQEEKTEGEG